MTSRYYNTSSPQSSPYRSYYASNPPSSSYSARRRNKMLKSNRQRPGTQWKAKSNIKDEDDKKTKFNEGEFSHEQIESELNKYKKGVFYHNDKIKKEAAKSAQTKSSATTAAKNKYSQFQLTRTYKRAPPQFAIYIFPLHLAFSQKIYSSIDHIHRLFDESLPRPVPPNYEKRIIDDDKKQNDAINVSRTKPRRPPNRKRSNNRKQFRPNIGPSPYDGLYGYYNYQQPASISQYGAYFGLDREEMAYGQAPRPQSSQYGFQGTDGMYYGNDILYGPPIANGGGGAVAPSSSSTSKVVKNGSSTVTAPNGTPTKSASKMKASAASNMSPGRRVNKIQKQLEYYFSPANMDNDTFLRESMDSHGWVNIDVIVAFNRMNVLGATKELVVEAAFHSTSIEHDTNNPDRIRMAKLWKEYVRKNKEKRRKEELKKQRELDLREVNEETIASIVELITKKEKRRQKRRELRKKQKEKEQQKTKKKEKKEDNKDEDTKKNDDEKENEKEKDTAKSAKSQSDEDMVEID